MKNLKILTSKGIEVELNDIDMMIINNYYEVQCTADFIRENYDLWDEEKVQWIANETRKVMDSYGIDEGEAIEVAINRYEERYE